MRRAERRGGDTFDLGARADVPLSTVFKGVLPFVLSAFVKLALLGASALASVNHV